MLRDFISKTNPGGPGWKKVSDEAAAEGNPIQFSHTPINIGLGIINMILGSLLVYGLLLGVGMVMYGSSRSGLLDDSRSSPLWLRYHSYLEKVCELIN